MQILIYLSLFERLGVISCLKRLINHFLKFFIFLNIHDLDNLLLVFPSVLAKYFGSNSVDKT